MSKFQKLFKKSYPCSSNPTPQSGPCYFRLNIIIGVLIFLFIFVYLFQVNGIANLGYKLRTLEDQASELELLNHQLELEVAQLQSSSVLKDSGLNQGFVPVDKVSYTSNTKLTVAVVK